ncbi:DivIVA domain-containing protein [Nakamurella antarctica]|uniref:DivIVA domain-containing protein n=1 Tax=Nakamurella antarctica TaxID=1902245 RepID=A0A3G8ZUH3_9ACTN|nr:DivIVA domain-containing protein [Nakamurella antarctica]AZI58134.1 DivIVA domain-containing protein [Nakamurella antarctica]
MTTVLQYLVIAVVVGLALFGIAVLIFGRGEQMAALPARTSPAQLPSTGTTGKDVRAVRFAMALRGYRMSDVDWTLDRLSEELDRTHAELALMRSAHPESTLDEREMDFMTTDPTPAFALTEAEAEAEAEAVQERQGAQGADIHSVVSFVPQDAESAARS